MSSRLFQEVRENLGLCYSIYSFLHCFSDTGLLGVGAAVGPENLDILLATIRQEIKKMQQQEVSPAELQAAQDYSRASFYLGAEDSDNRMMRLAKNEINFGHYISYEEIINQLEAVTTRPYPGNGPGMVRPGSMADSLPGARIDKASDI